MLKEIYQDYTAQGLTVVPIEWDTQNKQPVSHRNWSDTSNLKLSKQHNAIMIKTCNQFGCLDFDIKNTDNKEIFNQWKLIVTNQNPDLWSKLFIEKTRSAGYHVWLKYKGLERKLSLADSDKGTEVIALYANGPLVYTYPTPGYTEEYGSMADLQELTIAEFEYLISTSQTFNEYKPDYDPNLKAVTYPKGYEVFLSQFDKTIPDHVFTQVINDTGLFEIAGYRYNKNQVFKAFRRKGSEGSGISAKVYYHSKRVLIFSASMHDYPNWHNRYDYEVWSLTASFLLFYKLGRSWEKTIEYIQDILTAIGIEVETPKPLHSYPIHVFPEEIQQSILDVCEARSLALQFVCTAGLWTISSLAGSMYESDFNGDGKNILFCLLIAPVSVGKTPAYRVMCETPLKDIEERYDKEYAAKILEWQEQKDNQGRKPRRYMPITHDGTTEGYIAKSMMQPNGIGVYQDEAETILNAGSFKSNNDAISFFTQAFSGGRVAQIRADESKERVVPNLNLNLLMGTQPSRVKNIFNEERLSSGFASRFLMVEADYMELNTNIDPFSRSKEMCQRWKMIVQDLYELGHKYNSTGEKKPIMFSETAKEIYRNYYRQLLKEANTRIQSRAEQYIIGTEAKMSAYFPRLVQILAIMHNPLNPFITEQIVHNGYSLYRWYADSTIKVISRLQGEIDTGLPVDLELLYQSLPSGFTSKDAADVCKKIGLSERRFEISIRRKDFGPLFRKVKHGEYVKI